MFWLLKRYQVFSASEGRRNVAGARIDGRAFDDEEIQNRRRRRVSTRMAVRRRWFTSIADSILCVSAVISRVNELVSKGLYEQTLHFYRQELQPSCLHGSACTTFIFPSIIKACSASLSHYFGIQLHCSVLKMGIDSDTVVSNSLVSMYAKFSTMECARKVFDTMLVRDTITWNSMINSYIQNGCSTEALRMFEEMYACGFVPKPELIAGVLSLCGRIGDLRLWRAIHALTIVDERIEEESVFLSTALVDLYMKFHDSLMAFCVFDRMKVKNEVTWTIMISGSIANRNYLGAMDSFQAMQVEGIKPNRVTLITLLPVCAELGSNKHGKEIHGYAARRNFDSESSFSASLIHMYCECNETLHSAELIFERSAEKDVVMWSSMIKNYSQSEGGSAKAIRLFNQMRVEGVEPNSVTLLAIISACTTLSSLTHGQAIHDFVFKSGLNSSVFVGNSLINMYSKCGSLLESQQIFNEMPLKDSVSWSALISAYGQHGSGEEALKLFHEMQERGMEPDEITFLAVLSACNHAGLVEEGQKLFNNAKNENSISSTLEHYACHIDLLGRSGKLEDACEVVHTMPIKPGVRIWSSLVSACKSHGRLDIAEMLACRLIEAEPDNAANYTLLSMVYADSGNWLGVEEVRGVMRARGLKKNYGFSRN